MNLMTIKPKQSLLNPSLQRPSALDSKPRDLGMLWLDKNENIDPELNKITEKVLHDLEPLCLSTYPEAGELYRKLSSWVGVSPESLILTPGSDGAIRLIFESFVEQDDAVIHTAPTFAMYPVYSQIFGAKVYPVEYEPHADGPALNIEQVIKYIHDFKPKLFCLPNPDSPTGTVQDEEIMRLLLQKCEDVGAVFLVDEAYHPFYEWTAAPWTKNSRNLIVARTFAKAWGVAGLRVGYAIAHPDTIIYLHKIRPMYEVSTIAVEFMSKMFEHTEEVMSSVSRIKEGKQYFVNEMRALEFKVIPTDGNFVHVRFDRNAECIHRALKNKVYYRKAFNDACLEGFTRFTVGPKSIMEKVVNVIKNSNFDNK